MEKTVTNLERDTLSRNRIVSEINENFFVEAGAGSGKTTMLVNRMVAMVEAGIDISRICAITFTKAAAGEFYDRFQKLLIERSNPDSQVNYPLRPGSLPHPTDETRKRCGNALQNIDLCFMGTIDAFCNMVLSEHPTEAGIPSDATNMSDEDAAAVYRQQYVKICSGDCGEELRSLARTFQALHRNAQEVFVQGMSFIMKNRNVRFNFNQADDADIDKVFAAEKEELVAAVKCLYEHPELKYNGNDESRKAWDRISDTYNTIRRSWSSNYSGVSNALNSLRKIRLIPEAMNRYGVALGTLFVPGGKGKTPKWLEFSSGDKSGLPERLQELKYSVSMSFLTKSVPVMEKAMRDKGYLTYFDYLYYLRNMLKKDAGEKGILNNYIYSRHSYFLIDEFQDTNPLQAEVFFYLASEHPVPQWSACVPRKGSLFIVGDPKQSIYRFRSADVRSFLKVKKLFESNGGAILSLSRNFRSTRMLCEYFNRVFSALLPKETENQSRFEDIPLPDSTEDEFQGIYTYKAYLRCAVEEHPDMADSVRIADIIEHLVNNSRYQIRSEKNAELRPVRYSDFMVIAYGKKKLAPIMAELYKRAIPTRVEGDVPFAENDALSEIAHIFAAVADPDDTLALYGALTGQLFAFSKEDILRYTLCGGTVSLKSTFKAEGCSDATARKVSAQIERLKKLYSTSLRLSPAALFTRIMDDFRVYQVVSSEKLEIVYYALELLRNAEKTGLVITMKDGSAYLYGLIAGESGEERCLSLDAEKDCVHMANLHKVKGLEAPIVILAASSSASFPATFRLLHEDAGSEGYIFSLGGERDENGRSATYFQTDDYSKEKEDEGNALKAEAQRLVYVAATRARNALIICNSIRKYGAKEIPNSKWSPIIEPGLPDFFDVVTDTPPEKEECDDSVRASELYGAAEEGSALNNRSAEAASFATENPSRQPVLSKLVGSLNEAELEEAETAEAFSSDGKAQSEDRFFPALLGTMTHKLMEMLVMAGSKLESDKAVGEIIREYLTADTQSYRDQLTASLLSVAQTMKNGGYAQTNGLPKDMLGTLLTADEVYCEVPFCYVEVAEEGQTVWNGIMDAVYLADGKWHIVDYKTNADGSNLDKKYQRQLEAYEKAIKATMGVEANALTYHIDI